MLLSLFAMLCYLGSLLLIIPMLVKAQAGEVPQKPNKTLFILTALLAVTLHFVSLHPLIINLVEGHNFTLMEFGSLLSVLIALLATLAVLLKVKTLWFLLPVVYGFSIITISLAAFAPSHIVQHLSQNTGLLFHILMALFAYAVCFIAMLYSIQLMWVDRNLKSKKMALSPIIPPLMTVERHFFRVMLSGEILLTFTLLSGAIYLADFFGTQNIQKAALSVLSWLLFGILLFGHWRLHWRGKRMIIFTISGMILLSAD